MRIRNCEVCLRATSETEYQRYAGLCRACDEGHLDPACGSGAFLGKLGEYYTPKRIAEMVAAEEAVLKRMSDPEA